MRGIMEVAMKLPKTFVVLLVAAMTLFSTVASDTSPDGLAANTVRIRFAAGATSAQLKGHLDAHQSVNYVLRVGAGQLLVGDATAAGDKAHGIQLSIGGMDGTVLRSGMGAGANFSEVVPASQDYIITLRAGDLAADFNLRVMIPMQLKLASGATVLGAKGHLNPHQSLDYTVRAYWGQALMVNAVATAGKGKPDGGAPALQLVIYGVDGTVLRSGMGEGSSFRGVVPVSQDYLISVRAGETGADFSLTVIIPRRVRFGDQAGSYNLHARLLAGQTQYFSLYATAGQLLEVKLSPERNLQLIVYSMDGSVLKSGMGKDASFLGELPATQRYILAVRSAEEGAVYTIKVSLQSGYGPD
jgi:hypothetical protein